MTFIVDTFPSQPPTIIMVNGTAIPSTSSEMPIRTETPSAIPSLFTTVADGSITPSPMSQALTTDRGTSSTPEIGTQPTATISGSMVTASKDGSLASPISSQTVTESVDASIGGQVTVTALMRNSTTVPLTPSEVTRHTETLLPSLVTTVVDRSITPSVLS